LLITLYILIIDYSAYSQTSCDTSTISDIVNLQIKIADKAFKQKYVILKSSIQWDSLKDYYEKNSTYDLFLCGHIRNWNFFHINSKFGTVETDTTSVMEYSCFLGTPLFNENKTKCRIVMSIHTGEWGSSGWYYFYEKKGKKWKLVRQSLIWIS